MREKTDILRLNKVRGVRICRETGDAELAELYVGVRYPRGIRVAFCLVV